MDARAAIEAAMSETDFQAMVLEMAQRLGWACHHQIVPFKKDARGSHAIVEENTDPGFPDLVLVRGARLLFRELKTMKGKLSADQERWRDLLLAAGQDWALWRPNDWPIIERTLR